MIKFGANPNSISGLDIPHLLNTLISPTQNVIAAEITPFYSFTPNVDITSTSTFQLLGAFTLGSGSDGINPTTEDVSFSLGPFATTIPAGSFRSGPHGFYQFEAPSTASACRPASNPQQPDSICR